MPIDNNFSTNPYSSFQELPVTASAALAVVPTEVEQSPALQNMLNSIAQIAPEIAAVQAECRQLLEEVSGLRNSTFESLGYGTNDVRGTLKPGKSFDDVDHYKERLGALATMINSVKDMQERHGFITMGSMFDLSMNSSLGRDLMALKHGQPVPDFKTNCGTLQFG